MTARFTVLYPERDDTAWHDVEGFGAGDPIRAGDVDFENAAERHCADLCSRDPECYASFEGDGAIVMVRDRRFDELRAVRVTVESVPAWTARVLT